MFSAPSRSDSTTKEFSPGTVAGSSRHETLTLSAAWCNFCGWLERSWLGSMSTTANSERLQQAKADWAAWALHEEGEVLPCSKATKGAPELVKLFGKPAAQVSDAASTTGESDATASDDAESCGGGSALQAFLGRPKESFRVQHGFVGLTDHLVKDPRRSQSCPPRAMQAARAATVKPWWSLAPCAVVPCAVASESQQEKARATAGQVAEERVTTLLVRNIPSKLPRGELVGALEAIGLGDECDCIWMPFDKVSLKWKGSGDPALLRVWGGRVGG
jgi:hypothetical protein